MKSIWNGAVASIDRFLLSDCDCDCDDDDHDDDADAAPRPSSVIIRLPCASTRAPPAYVTLLLAGIFYLIRIHVYYNLCTCNYTGCPEKIHPISKKHIYFKICVVINKRSYLS